MPSLVRPDVQEATMRTFSKLLFVPLAAGILAVAAAPALAQDKAQNAPRPAHPAPAQHSTPAPKVAEKKADPKAAPHTKKTARAEEREAHARDVAAFRKQVDAEKQRHNDKLKQLRQDRRRVDKSKDKGWKTGIDQQITQEMARHKQWSKDHKAPSAPSAPHTAHH